MKVLDRIGVFLKDHPELSERDFGVAAINDPCLIVDLRAGRVVKYKTNTRILSFMFDYRFVPGAFE